MIRSRHLVVLVAAAALACRARDRVAIGIVVGADGVEGARFAAADVNRTGGIEGTPLELVIVPSAQATAAQPSIRIADSLASMPRVLAVVGHSNSAASLAASQIYNARHLAQIAPTTTAPLYTSAGPYSFRLVPDDRQQATFLVEHAAAAHARRIALLYVNDDYGRALREALHRDLAQAGIAVAYETPFLENEERERLETAARAVVDAAPDLVLWIGRPTQLAVFYAELRRLAPSVPVLASDGMDSSPIYVRPDLFLGVRVVRFVDAQAPDPALAEFRARYRAATHREPTTDAVLAYDATMLLAAAMRSGARTRDAVRAWLASVGMTRPPYIGLGGPIAFDANGDVMRLHRLAEVRADGVHAVP